MTEYNGVLPPLSAFSDGNGEFSPRVKFAARGYLLCGGVQAEAGHGARRRADTGACTLTVLVAICTVDFDQCGGFNGSTRCSGRGSLSEKSL